MTNEKLGVLLVDVPEPRYAKYCYLEYSQGNYTIFFASKKETVELDAYKCTQEEAEKIPTISMGSVGGVT